MSTNEGMGCVLTAIAFLLLMTSLWLVFDGFPLIDAVLRKAAS